MPLFLLYLYLLVLLYDKDASLGCSSTPGDQRRVNITTHSSNSKLRVACTKHWFNMAHDNAERYYEPYFLRTTLNFELDVCSVKVLYMTDRIPAAFWWQQGAPRRVRICVSEARLEAWTYTCAQATLFYHICITVGTCTCMYNNATELIESDINRYATFCQTFSVTCARFKKIDRSTLKWFQLICQLIFNCQ